MKQPKNEAIGEVECPTKGCTKKIPVFRFRQRTAARSIFAGKLYADCPVHGRHGADGKAGTQEYLLENSKIWGANDTKPAPAATEPAPKPAPNTPPERPAIPAVAKPAGPGQLPAPSQEPKPAPRWWKTLLDQ
jgi:hypothetical protein